MQTSTTTRGERGQHAPRRSATPKVATNARTSQRTGSEGTIGDQDGRRNQRCEHRGAT